jgi:hypothetical protein
MPASVFPSGGHLSAISALLPHWIDSLWQVRRANAKVNGRIALLTVQDQYVSYVLELESFKAHHHHGVGLAVHEKDIADLVRKIRSPSLISAILIMALLFWLSVEHAR